MKTIDTMWDILVDLGVSEQTLQIVTAINGYNEKTMLDVLDVTTGYKNFEQIDD